MQGKKDIKNKFHWVKEHERNRHVIWKRFKKVKEFLMIKSIF